jgi:CelD/BcsL family acetyltransferase involved in cellulose biosynthesis
MQALRDAGAAVEIRTIQHTSVIDLARGEKAYFDGISKKLRQNTNLAENGLKRQGALEMREVANSDDWRDWLERAFELEAAGWKGEQGSAIGQSPHELEFYRRVFGAARSEDRFRLYVLLLDGELIAFNALVLVDGVYYGFKTAFDERHAKQSPGNVLQRFVLRVLFAEGRANKLDMLDPVTPWKERWQTGTEALLRIYLYAPTPRGRLVYWARKAAHALRGLKKSQTLTA